MKLSSKIKLFWNYFLPHPGRIVNLAMLSISRNLRLTKVLGKPITAMIEPTNYCNLKCPLCPTGAGLIKRKKENLSLKDFKRIVDNLPGSVVHMRLWNWGEPLLNKEFPEMVRYAKSKDMFVNTSTNSAFLNEKIITELVDSGLDQLIVSLDGASEETYNKYRKNGNFSQVVSALKKAAEIKEKLGKKNPEIKLQFIVMKHNEHEVERMIQLAKEVRADTLFLKTVGVMDLALKKDISKFLPKSAKFQRYETNEGRIPLSGKVCRYLWDEVTVNVDGTVVPCCRDAHGKYVLGNIKEQKLSEIWNSTAFVNFRRKVLENKDDIDICRNCSGSNREFSIQEITL